MRTACRLPPKSPGWPTGEINWLIDLIAPDKMTAAAVIGTFKQVVKGGELRIHPIVGRLVDPEARVGMGVKPAGTNPGREPGAVASGEIADSQ